jgi:hypothetical protein
MEDPKERNDRLQRLIAAAIVIFSVCSVVGVLLGYAEFGLAAGAVLALFLSRPLSKYRHPMEFPRGSMLPAVVSLLLVFALCLAALLLWGRTDDPVLRFAVGLLPAPALIAFALFVGRSIAKLEDLQRRIQIEGIAMAFGIFIVLVSLYGWLTLFGAPQVHWIFATPALALCWVVGKLASTLRYR